MLESLSWDLPSEKFACSGFLLNNNLPRLSIRLARCHTARWYWSAGILRSILILEMTLRVNRFLFGSDKCVLSCLACVSLHRIVEEWFDLRTLLDLFPQQFDGLLGDFFQEYRESANLFLEPHMADKVMIQLLRDSYRKVVVPPGEQCQVPPNDVYIRGKCVVLYAARPIHC